MNTATLSKFWDTYKPQIVGGLAGAGLGAAGLGGAAALSGETDPEERTSNLQRNLLLGAVLGGVGGVGAGTVYDRLNNPPPASGFLARQLGKLTDSNAAAGAGIGLTANAALSRVQNNGLPFAGKGGNLGGKDLKELQDRLQSLVKEYTDPKVIKGAPTPPPAITGSSGQTEIRNLIDRMTANQSTLGKWSQKPLVRALGLNVAKGEGEVADVLRTLRGANFTGPAGPVTGEELIKQLLKQRTSTGSAFPFIEKDLLGGGEAGRVIGKSRLGSTIGRAGLGALLYPAAVSINSLGKPTY